MLIYLSSAYVGFSHYILHAIATNFSQNLDPNRPYITYRNTSHVTYEIVTNFSTYVGSNYQHIAHLEYQIKKPSGQNTTHIRRHIQPSSCFSKSIPGSRFSLISTPGRSFSLVKIMWKNGERLPGRFLRFTWFSLSRCFAQNLRMPVYICIYMYVCEWIYVMCLCMHVCIYACIYVWVP